MTDDFAKRMHIRLVARSFFNVRDTVIRLINVKLFRPVYELNEGMDRLVEDKIIGKWGWRRNASNRQLLSVTLYNRPEGFEVLL